MSVSSPDRLRNRQLRSFRNVPAVQKLHEAPGLSSTMDIATVHFTIAIRAAQMKAEDALKLAVEALKKLDATAIIEAALMWMKTHPWETAAIIIPLVLMAVMPAALGLAGFTAGGIAAGSFTYSDLPSRRVTDLR
jgi:hypothetical protein